jgi:hypothetical protein
MSWRDQLITNLLAMWTLAGVFLDGWAHSKSVRKAARRFPPLLAPANERQETASDRR